MKKTLPFWKGFFMTKIFSCCFLILLSCFIAGYSMVIFCGISVGIGAVKHKNYDNNPFPFPYAANVGSVQINRLVRKNLIV
jgi:hypothetical protein